MGCLVTHVDLRSVQVKDHDGNVTPHEVGNILWTAGVEAPPLAHMVAKATGAEQDRAGRLLCGKDLSLPDHPDILVTGDMTCLDKQHQTRKRPIRSDAGRGSGGRPVARAVGEASPTG